MMTTTKSWNALVRVCCGLAAVGTVFAATGCDQVGALAGMARATAGQTIAESVNGVIGDAVGGGLDDLLGDTMGS